MVKISPALSPGSYLFPPSPLSQHLRFIPSAFTPPHPQAAYWNSKYLLRGPFLLIRKVRKGERCWRSSRDSAGGKSLDIKKPISQNEYFRLIGLICLCLFLCLFLAHTILGPVLRYRAVGSEIIAAAGLRSGCFGSVGRGRRITKTGNIRCEI
jgi:hypothetical protein